MKKVIRKTKAYCSKCLKKVDSDIIQERNNLYITKHCPDHKEKINLSHFVKYDLPLHDMFFKLGLDKNVSHRRLLEKVVLFYITLRCNLYCSMCSSHSCSKKFKEPTLDEIKSFLKNKKKWKISLFGGEPTVRKDLPNIISLVKKEGNIPFLFTNGVKLSNFNYLYLLKQKGLAGIDFSFGGFNDKYYIKFRGKPLLRNKLNVLKNLKKLNIETNLECVIIDGENTDQLYHIIDFAVRNNFINSVVFRPYNYLGRKGIPEKKILNPMDIINYLENLTDGLITKKKIFEFQRFLYVLSDILNLRICSYNRYYLLFRRGGKFKTIHDLFPLTKIQKDIDRYMKLKTKNQILAKSYFIFSFILKSLLNLNQQIIYLAPVNLNIFQKNMIKSPKNLLPLKFTLNCDARIFDADIAKNCTMYQYRNDLGFCTSALMNIIHEKNIKTNN